MSRIFLLALLLGWAAPCLADSRPPIYVLGFDGLSWKVLEPLMDRLPNFARCRENGVSGVLGSLPGFVSPALWTTVATGVPPAEHGILDFMGAHQTAYTSRDRKVPALWNMFSESGRSSLVVNFFVTDPAEPINGVIVSKEYRFNQPPRGAVSPESAISRLSGIVEPDLSTRVLNRFLAPEGGSGDARFSPAVVAESRSLRDSYYGDEFATRVAEALLAADRYDLFLFHFWGTDVVAHEFGLYSPFDGRKSAPELARAFRPTLENYYVYADEVMGRLISGAAPDAVIIVLSDHGLKPLPMRRVNNNLPHPQYWEHDFDDGVIIACGPGIAHARLKGARLLDVAPTILFLEGLPIAKSMTGKVLSAMFKPIFLDSHPVSRTDSYRFDRSTAAVDTGRLTQSLLEKLRSAGYVR